MPWHRVIWLMMLRMSFVTSELLSPLRSSFAASMIVFLNLLPNPSGTSSGQVLFCGVCGHESAVEGSVRGRMRTFVFFLHATKHVQAYSGTQENADERPAASILAYGNKCSSRIAKCCCKSADSMLVERRIVFFRFSCQCPSWSGLRTFLSKRFTQSCSCSSVVLKSFPYSLFGNDAIKRHFFS